MARRPVGGQAAPVDLTPLEERIEQLESAPSGGGSGTPMVKIQPTAPTDQTPLWVKTPS